MASDSILANLEEPLRRHLAKANQAKHTPKNKPLSESFVKAGKDSKPKSQRAYSYLDNASDWQLLIDYDHCQIVFPPNILSTPERPDIILWSNSARKVLIVELTCPAEQGIEAAEIRKKSRYANLIGNIPASWAADILTIEVGARGFVALSTVSFLKKIGFDNRTINTIIKAVSNTALRCSYAIYLASKSEKWIHRELLICLPDSLKEQNQPSPQPEVKEEKCTAVPTPNTSTPPTPAPPPTTTPSVITATSPPSPPATSIRRDKAASRGNSQTAKKSKDKVPITSAQRERMEESKRQALARKARKCSVQEPPKEDTTLTTAQKEQIDIKRKRALDKLAQREAARAHPYMTRQKTKENEGKGKR